MTDGPDKPTPREIFLEMIELPLDDRSVWLDEHVDDPALRAEVAALLEHHDAATGMLSGRAWRDRSIETGGDDTRPSTPERIGDFEIVREAGRGGMGIVYLARDQSLDRSVALKVLPAWFAEAEGSVARFKREAKAIAQLSHPGIVPIYRVGEEEGTHFIAMQFVGEGLTLAQKLAVDRERREDGSAAHRSRVESRRHKDVASLIASIADALDHAHQHHIIHRDVKPSNVLLTADGQPRLVDFGLAKDLSAQTVTETGTLAGTVRYMSPEQAKAARVKIDHRTDIFSLGVVLYEALTFTLPFDGETAHQVLSALLALEPRRVRSLNPAVPRDLETICHMAMEKEPERRYQTAGQLAADLRAVVADNSIMARPPSLVRKTRLWIRRHRLACIVGLTVLLGATVAGLIARQETQRRAQLCPVSISCNQPGAVVTVRRFDDETLELGAAVRLGPLPLETHRLEPGHYRFTLVAPDGNFVEISELLDEPGVPREIDVTIRAEDATANMISMPTGSYAYGRPGVTVGLDRERTLALPAFWIDATEVSNADYREFLLATQGTPPKYMGSDYDAEAMDSLPVVGITHREAQLYARWRGKRLPTMFEWEAAARAPAGWLLPWSAQRAPAPAGADLTVDKLLEAGSNDSSVLRGAYMRNARPVDSLPELNTARGMHHTFGNVMEFTDNILFARAKARVVKGSSWTGSPLHADLSNLRMFPGGVRVYTVGFRCARSGSP